MRLYIWVQPSASGTNFVGLHDGNPKFRVAAKAQDNKANAALCKFIAGSLGIRKTEVMIVAGQTSRKKLLEIPDKYKTRFQDLFCHRPE